MIRRALYFLCCWSMLLVMPAIAQDTIELDGRPPVFDSLKLLYPFLNLEQNTIRGDSAALFPFFRKLLQLEQGGKSKAIVVHIGDSHIQAGFVTKPVRDGLQAQFGNAGPGLIFPYRVAKSNGPPGYLSAADTPWIATRNAAVKKILPTGVSGFTLWSRQPSPSFTISFTSPEVIGKPPSHLTVFHADRDTCRMFSVSNDGTGQSYPVTDSSGRFYTTYRMEDQPGKIRVRGIRPDDSLKSASFYGMSLTSDSAGVVVHMIGVNGATYNDYLHSVHFVEQLAVLQPDLIVISLGTNEAANPKTFDKALFTASVDSLMTRIRQKGIDAGMLITTPPGIYQRYRKKRRSFYKPNPVADTVGVALKDYAEKNSMAWWDWYTIMGGQTGMAKWKAKKMTDKRYIHFTSKGYTIQGLLLYEALDQQYRKFKSGR